MSRKLFIISWTAVSLTSGAVAADLNVGYVKSSPPVAYNWSGFYFGVNAGYNWNRTQGADDRFVNSLTDQRLAGGVLGGQVGVNHQIGRAVIGIEISGAWSNAKNDSDCFVQSLNYNGSFNCHAAQDFSAMILGRVGYAPGDGRFLPYLLGGVAMANLRTSKEVPFASSTVLPGATISVSPWGVTLPHQGAVIGAGAQYAVGPNASVGLDYLYGIYGLQEHGGPSQYIQTFLGQSFTGSVITTSPQNLTTHTVRFIFNYRLD